GADQADYVMLRYAPNKDFAKEPAADADVVVVVDTSAGGDESARQLRITAAEGALRALSDHDHFALVSLDVTPTVVYPKEGLASATEADIAKALEKLSDHAVGGATDLGAMFEPALERLHGTDQPAIVYVGDGVATSGETTSEGLSDRMRRSLTGSRARFFTVGVGADAKQELLTQLSRDGGGEHLRIDESEQTTEVALRLVSAIKTPTITDLNVDLGAGLDQPFASSTGSLSRGKEYVLLARTHHALPSTVKVSGRIGGKDATWTYPVSLENDVVTSLVPRLWASEYIRRLIGAGVDDNRAKILSLGLEYGLMTPHSSILALESEAAYARDGIPRRKSPVRGVRLTSIETDTQERHLVERFGVTPPAAMAGCDRSAPTSSEEKQVSQTAQKASGLTPSNDTTTEPGAPMATVLQPPPTPPSFAQTTTGNGTGGGSAFAEVARNDQEPTDVPSAHRSALPQGAAHARPISQSSGAAAGIIHGGARVGPVALDANAGKDVGITKGGERVVDKPTKLDGDFKTGATGQGYRRTTVLSRCSDAASRPLAERIVLWTRRLKPLTSATETMDQFDQARAACELPDWRDEAALLDLVEKKVTTEDAAQAVLVHLGGDPDAQAFVARKILRRTVDVRLAAAVERTLFGGIDWAKVDRDLLDAKNAEDRLAKLRLAMLQAPGDPQGDIRLVKLLVDAGHRDEAIAHGRRLRDRGLLTPTLAQELGDVLADAGEQDEALRTYSEVVEFDPADPAARRVLGDIYLRRGWYDAAYRQYKTLIDIDGRDPLSHLR
ncbi:MAG: tetratricopeptide repeat protein, partial [Polyangiaceae bacterium]